MDLSRASEVNIQGFNLLARPRRAAQKLEARFNTRIEIEAANLNALAQFCPAIMLHEPGKNHLERNPVERIFERGLVHVD